jgi:uncharacterized protein YggE
MANEKPNTLQIREVQKHEIAADRADLHVTVEGASLFTGGEALHKAREVAQLVRELTEYGLPPAAIYLQGVYADTATGLLGKTSAARYKLRLHCADLAQLADLLGIISGQKNARLNIIDWGYPDDDDLKDQWLGECLTRANAKAARVALGLGVRLLGVHGFSEKYQHEEAPHRTAVAYDMAAMSRSRAARVSPEELGLEISHTKTVQVSVDLEYLVSGYEPTP